MRQSTKCKSSANQRSYGRIIVYTAFNFQRFAGIYTQFRDTAFFALCTRGRNIKGLREFGHNQRAPVRATSPYQSKRNPRAGSFVLLSTNYASSGLPVRSSYAWRYFSIVLSTISCGSVQSLSGLALSQSLANCLSNDGWL